MLNVDKIIRRFKLFQHPKFKYFFSPVHISILYEFKFWRAKYTRQFSVSIISGISNSFKISSYLKRGVIYPQNFWLDKSVDVVNLLWPTHDVMSEEEYYPILVITYQRFYNITNISKIYGAPAK